MPKQVGKGWESVKKKKIIIPINSYPTRYKEFQKIAKQFKKLKKKNYYGFFSSQNKLGNPEREWNWKLSFRLIPTRPAIEDSPKIEKKLKKLKKHDYLFFSCQNKLGKAEKEWK